MAKHIGKLSTYSGLLHKPWNHHFRSQYGGKDLLRVAAPSKESPLSALLQSHGAYHTSTQLTIQTATTGPTDHVTVTRDFWVNIT